MSERNVKLFYDEMCKNEKLQNEIKDVIGRTLSEKSKKILLNDIAKKYNFDFTPEEAKKFAENLSKNELSLDDLSGVSGGIGKRAALIAFTALTTLGSLGTAGAIVSHAGKTPPSSPMPNLDKKNTTSTNADIGVPNPNTGRDATNPNTSSAKNTANTNAGGDATDPNTSSAKNTANTNAGGGNSNAFTSNAKEGNNKDKEVNNNNNNENAIDNNDETKQMELEKTGNYQVKNNTTKKDEAVLKTKITAIEERKNKAANSEIINADNINIFEGLVCPTENLNRLYKMTRDGATNKAMQEKIKGHSNIVVLVKTDEGKTLGGYTSCKIEYNNKEKSDNKAFLFSIDLNEKFNIKENACAIIDTDSCGICFAGRLTLYNNKCHSQFGKEYPSYKTNGITIDEFCGGTEEIDIWGIKYNTFKPVEIEIFEIKEEQNEQENIKIKNEDNEANKKNK